MALWFKAKRYGWGWTPSTWQGWIILSLFALVIGYQVAVLMKAYSLTRLIMVFVTVVLLLIICYLKGEKPRWRWG